MGWILRVDANHYCTLPVVLNESVHMKLVAKHDPHRTPHNCDTSGCLTVRVGSVWQCDECAFTYKLAAPRKYAEPHWEPLPFNWSQPTERRSS